MNLDLRFYWKLLLRRFPIMALLFTVSTMMAAFTAMRMPETYSTSARLLVEEPQIPANMVASTVRTDAVEQLDVIQQRLLTRANFIDIANRFNVYEDLRTAEPDAIVNRMQRDTEIRRTTARDRATVMTISFTGREGQIAANVVNEYVTLVLEANASFRMGRAESTLEFFEQEVERLGQELDAQSVRIATFKSENSDALPENQTFRLGRQTLLQERLARMERDLHMTVSQRDDIESIFEATGQVGQRSEQQRPISNEERQLLVARTDLSRALATYTPENPRVVRLQAIVDRLEAIIASQAAAVAVPGEEEDGAMSAAEAMFQATMIEIENRIQTMQTDVEETKEQLDTLERSIAASSVNGFELAALQRDFEIIQTRYNAAVVNLNQAQVGERIETTAQGQRITVIENANAPRLPSGPDRPRVIAMGAALGLGMAGGFFVLLELLNRTVRRPAELIGRFNVTPIATIPYLESRGRRTARRLALVIGTLIAVIGVPLLLWYIDTNYMPLNTLVQRVLALMPF
ncbi:chain length-determining protein [Octadecabacter sp. CECT 8868]|uniref:GumC family protein n=1 Tax=Octadecabacter algicola TaxID=2909342 RepID=UPI001F33225D|nr:chain length-determining protein [Octadecabacter algicola]MCF2906691.1 chain length-determining protein [Octadecabacter algicola]